MPHNLWENFPNKCHEVFSRLLSSLFTLENFYLQIGQFFSSFLNQSLMCKEDKHFFFSKLRRIDWQHSSIMELKGL